jgi:hypothetical protein
VQPTKELLGAERKLACACDALAKLDNGERTKIQVGGL